MGVVDFKRINKVWKLKVMTMKVVELDPLLSVRSKFGTLISLLVVEFNHSKTIASLNAVDYDLFVIKSRDRLQKQQKKIMIIYRAHVIIFSKL